MLSVFVPPDPPPLEVAFQAVIARGPGGADSVKSEPVTQLLP